MTEEKRATAPICVRCMIGGRVQGVFFRANTRHQAQALGLTGYARNLPDGRVEVLACGEPEALDKLGEWLHDGPPHARVDKVSARNVEQESPGDFRTG